MSPELRAAEHGLSSNMPHGWWLDVTWRFGNPSARPLHVLTEGPVSILDARPLVLNHAATGHPLEIDPNQPPAMAFAAVPARGHLDLERRYPLPPMDLATPRPCVGRFSVGYEPPDPDWISGRVWQAVARWQQVLESAPFEIRAPG